MEIVYTDKAKADIAYFKKIGDKSIQNKIQVLISDIELHPETGLGKPEKLKHQYSGYWSRRINKEHRIIYDVKSVITIYSLRGHYE
jgi:toxin YoeB